MKFFKSTKQFSMLPSISTNHVSDQVNQLSNQSWTHSLDEQYNFNSSLRLDVSLNPDFSQVEVERQVTNLSRFEINFPERRKLFLENFDLLRQLGINLTTFVQYNTQLDNLNINSRFQWEYKPLSYIYLVVTNNYNGSLLQKNWGLSLKVNRRLDF